MVRTKTQPRETAAPEQPASIRVYNTLSKTKEPLEPVTPGKIGIYLCGPTVYKPSHIGHMVGPVIFDAIKRYLTYSGYQVTWVVNITDVDDKLIQESRAKGIEMSALADEMTADYMRNLQAMGVDTIDHFPKATAYMGEIIAMTQILIDKGFAYESEGDVYFDVAKDPGYGKLTNRSIETMHGEGGETADRKRSPADFALWKSAKPGEPSWSSPWGEGRPGWHIECSAMSGKLLGETFDMHGGGLDLVFPHHENEVAQSQCAHGKPQAKYWMHNGLMQASSEVGKVGGRATREVAAGDLAGQEHGKISKSKGANAFSDLLKRHEPETIRFFLLSTHYRSPIDYSEERLEELGRGASGFYRFFKRYQRITGQDAYAISVPRTRQEGEFETTSPLLTEVAQLRRKFLEAMDDDFNTGGAMASLHDLLRTLNKFIDAEKLETPGKLTTANQAILEQGAKTLREISGTLGLFRAPVAENSAGDDALVGQLMDLLIELRASARKSKDFATADKVRQGLTTLGITLEDRPDGTGWTRS